MGIIDNITFNKISQMKFAVKMLLFGAAAVEATSIK